MLKHCDHVPLYAIKEGSVELAKKGNDVLYVSSQIAEHACVPKGKLLRWYYMHKIETNLRFYHPEQERQDGLVVCNCIPYLPGKIKVPRNVFDAAAKHRH